MKIGNVETNCNPTLVIGEIPSDETTGRMTLTAIEASRWSMLSRYFTGGRLKTETVNGGRSSGIL